MYDFGLNLNRVMVLVWRCLGVYVAFFREAKMDEDVVCFVMDGFDVRYFLVIGSLLIGETMIILVNIFFMFLVFFNYRENVRYMWN